MPTNARPAVEPTAPDTPDTLRAKIEEQGVAATAAFEHVLGAGRDLWTDDADFERFLEAVRGFRDERE